MSKLKIALLTLFAVALVPAVALSNGTQAKPAVKKFQTSIDLNDKNLVVINDEIDGATTSKAIRQLRDLDEKLGAGLLGDKNKAKADKKAIYLWLASPGGSVRLGSEFIDAVKGLNRPVHTITLIAASMAFQIAEALDDRYITANGTLMSHHAYTEGLGGEYGGKAPSQLDSRYGWIKDTVDEYDRNVVARTNGKQTLESYQAAYENELYRRGQRAVDEGYADAVVTAKCDKSLNGVETRHTVVMGIIPIDYDIDNCPLNTAPMNVRLSIQTNKGTMSSDQFTSAGGGFTPQCLMESATDKNKICALDTSMSQAKIDQIKRDFSTQYVNKQKTPLPLIF